MGDEPKYGVAWSDPRAKEVKDKLPLRDTIAVSPITQHPTDSGVKAGMHAAVALDHAVNALRLSAKNVHIDVNDLATLKGPDRDAARGRYKHDIEQLHLLSRQVKEHVDTLLRFVPAESQEAAREEIFNYYGIIDPKAQDAHLASYPSSPSPPTTKLGPSAARYEVLDVDGGNHGTYVPNYIATRALEVLGKPVSER